VGLGSMCRTRKCRAKKFEFYPLKLGGRNQVGVLRHTC